MIAHGLQRNFTHQMINKMAMYGAQTIIQIMEEGEMGVMQDKEIISRKSHHALEEKAFHTKK